MGRRPLRPEATLPRMCQLLLPSQPETNVVTDREKTMNAFDTPLHDEYSDTVLLPDRRLDSSSRVCTATDYFCDDHCHVTARAVSRESMDMS
jgi:hypothetical protein